MTSEQVGAVGAGRTAAAEWHSLVIVLEPPLWDPERSGNGMGTERNGNGTEWEDNGTDPRVERNQKGLQRVGRR